VVADGNLELNISTMVLFTSMRHDYYPKGMQRRKDLIMKDFFHL
jgi:hypothetical protein